MLNREIESLKFNVQDACQAKLGRATRKLPKLEQKSSPMIVLKLAISLHINFFDEKE
jgi:hypothetical protein